MVRTLTEEEKIRRAIEISQRRNQRYYTNETARVNVNNKKKYKLFKKMILQIIICLLIYLIFYLISTTNYVFSEKVLNSVTSILTYDINIKKLYNNSKNLVINFLNNGDSENQKNITNSVITNNVVNDVISKANENIVYINNITNSVVIENEDNYKADEKDTINNQKENDEEKIQDELETAMRKDAEKVKKICEFQKPLSGTITSEFGEREIIMDGMTSDHKGIDIAAKSGTNIKAAMSGTVSVAEENSEYGKFIKIVSGDVMTVYAHCKSLNVKKGDKVKKGQIIATVGSTGRSTGPHLHFEIRLSGRYINPRYVINF